MKTPSWLEEVIRDPEDEYTRLVAADVMESVDPARAAFIRAQVATEQSLAAATAPAEVAAALEAEPLPVVAWIGELQVPYGIAMRGFARGFIEHVQVAARDVVARPDWLFAHAPIRFLTLVHAEAHAPAIAASPWLARVRALRIPRRLPYEGRSSASFVDVRGSSRVAEMAEVNAIDDGVVRALCDSPYLANLQLLDVSGHGEISIATWVALARAAPKLRWVVGAPRRGRWETLDAGYELSRWFEDDPVAAAIELQHGARVAWLGSVEQLGWWPRLRATCAGARLPEVFD